MKKLILKPTPVDKGWSWVILSCAVISYALAIGSLKCFGLLFSEFLEIFGKSTANTAFIPSIHIASVHFTGLPANYLTTRFGTKNVVITGGILCSAGYLSTAFVPRMEFMFMTSALAGIGVGFVTTPTVAITNHYFLKHRAKAVGIVTSSASTIMLGLPHLYRFLIEKYSIRGALIIISGILLHICVSASLYRQPILRYTDPRKLENSTRELREDENSEMITLQDRELLSEKETKLSEIGETEQALNPKKRNKEDLSGAKDSEIGSLNSYKQQRSYEETKPSTLRKFHFALIKNPAFLCIAFSYFTAMSGYSMMLITLPVYAKVATLESGSSAAALSSLGIAETITKILVGSLIDKDIVTCRTIWSCLLMAASIVAICMTFARSLVVLCILSALFGATGGSIFILLPQTLVQNLGIDMLVSGLGFSTMFSGVGSLLSSPLAGFIKDETGSWSGAHVSVACLCVCSAFIVQLEKIREILYRKKRHR